MDIQVPGTEYPHSFFISSEEKDWLLAARKEKLRVKRNEVALKDKARLEEGLKGVQSVMETLNAEMDVADSNDLMTGTDLQKLGAAVETGLEVLVDVARKGEKVGEVMFNGSVTLVSACRLDESIPNQIEIAATKMLEEDLRSFKKSREISSGTRLEHLAAFKESSRLFVENRENTRQEQERNVRRGKRSLRTEDLDDSEESDVVNLNSSSEEDEPDGARKRKRVD